MGTRKCTPMRGVRAVAVAAPVVALVGPAVYDAAKRALYARAIDRAHPRYPYVTIAPEHGDPEYLLKLVCRELQRHGTDGPEVLRFIHEATARDYPHLLLTVARWVTVDE